jgi:hypothetical protein
MRRADAEEFTALIKVPAVIMPCSFDLRVMVERSCPEMTPPRVCASKVTVYGNSNPVRHEIFDKSLRKMPF